jgi:FixJ family two-component response regulator
VKQAEKAASGHAFLAKPFTKAALLDAIQAALR